jgi:saccharopine dehydrogenase-like NADP-dependent oxidoreductase
VHGSGFPRYSADLQGKMRALIIGQGRIAAAVSYYARVFLRGVNVSYFSGRKDAAQADLLIGTLPGGLGEQSLELALKYKKDLIDLADLDTDFYPRHRKQIERANITVIPACGFCPGLVNFIIGTEAAHLRDISNIEVMAGSLSPLQHYFPFLWCFEDLVLEFMVPSWQMVEGKKRTFPPFGGYRSEKIFGIDAESYFGQSGFENLTAALGTPSFTYRNIRPAGFMQFFRFLHNYGLFKKKNILSAKKMLEERKEDNLSLARIRLCSSGGHREWLMKSFSKKGERFNSIQKITALFTIGIIGAFGAGRIREKGLVFCQTLGKDDVLFRDILSGLKKQGIVIKYQK